MRCLVTILLVLILISTLFAIQQMSAVQQEKYSVSVSTDLVSLSVSVTRRAGGFVLGLDKVDFRIYEDGIEQVISFFNPEKEPVSWGVILDRSRSMEGMIRQVSAAGIHIIDEGTPQDEMFILAFNEKAQLVRDFDSDRKSREMSVHDLRADGYTALWDAVAYGLDHIKTGRHRKKVLVVVTDGEDNRSRFTFRELINRAEEEHVLIYTIGMFDRFSGETSKLKKLAQITGATAHFPRSLQHCLASMDQIASEVGQQYSLGYYPTNAARDGQWRKIQVVVQQPDAKSTFVVRTRPGYYAQKEATAK